MSNKKKKSKGLTVILVLFIAAAAVCFGIFLYRLFIYQKEAGTYEAITEEYTTDKTDSTDTEKTDAEPDEEAMRVIDWDALLAANPDTVGWIEMSPEIDYPIVQGDTNQSYLHTDFNGDYAFSGCLFISSDNAPNWTDTNTVIYGHNMIDGSMFGDLDYYYDKSYAEEHPFIYIYTPDGRYTYRIARDMVVTDGGTTYSTGLFSEEVFEDYLKRSATEGSLNYTVDPDITGTDRIITLSTCRSTSSSSRHVVQAVLDGFTDYDGNTYSADQVNAAMDELRNIIVPHEIIEG